MSSFAPYTDDVAVQISTGIFQIVSHTSLCREMNDHVRLEGVYSVIQQLLIFQHTLSGGKAQFCSSIAWRRCLRLTS